MVWNKNNSNSIPPFYNPVDFDPFSGGEISLIVPATDAQKEIWLSAQMGKDASCAFIESMTLTLMGNLNLDIFKKSVHELILRHEALRITFSPDGENLCIYQDIQIDVVYHDLCNLDDFEKKKAEEKLYSDEMEEPFDLEHGPLFRVKILCVSDKLHKIIISAHHIVCDGWSWGILLRDLGKIYDSFVNNQTLELEPALRFSDYAFKLNKRKNSREVEEARKYWVDLFGNNIPQLDILTDFPRPSTRMFQADRFDWQISSELLDKLQKVAAQKNCSLVMILLAALEVLLYRITDQEDLVVGIASAGQAAEAMFELVGHCVNLLPLKTSINPDLPFDEYLQTRKAALLDAYDHQQIAYVDIITHLPIQRVADRIPLVPIAMNVEQTIVDTDIHFDGLSVSISINPRHYENFEIFINIV